MTESQKGKLKCLLLKITIEWKLQDLHEFSEQHDNQISLVKFCRNNTKNQIHRYTHSLPRLMHPK